MCGRTWVKSGNESTHRLMLVTVIVMAEFDYDRSGGKEVYQNENLERQ
jgi:hypothetical protein